MKNRRALFSCLTSLTMLMLAVMACEDDQKSEFDGGGETPDADFDTGPGFQKDDATTGDKDAAVSCKPGLPTTFKPAFTAVAHKDACEYEQLTGYYEHCLATENGNAKLRSQECEDWKNEAANSDCAKCIETDDNSGPVQIYNERLYYTLNNAGCVAIKQGNSTCAEKWDTSAACRRESCKSCLDQKGAVFQNFLDCQSATLQAGGDCVKYQSEAETACQATGFKDASAPGSAADCFGKNKEEAQGIVFVRVEGVFCGKQ